MACKLGALFLFCFIITLSPWLIRNLYTFGSLSLSTVGQYNLIALYVLPMEMERRNQSFKEVQKAIMEEVDQEIRQEGQKPEELNDFQKSRYWVKFGLHYIGKYPLPFAKHYLLGIFHSFANLGTGPFGDLLQLSKKEGKFEIKAQSNIPHLLNDWWQQKTSQEIQLGVLIGFYLLITYFFLGVGLIAYWRKKRDHPFLVFSLMLVLYFILITGTAGLARFKLPAIPFYLVFVGMGLSHVIRKKGHTNRKESA
ncbi:MAG: hypothetical protein L7F78_19505, partial [Syntrophales bacterium LBB04]|nr:hypothetical protein [Syntrophales bacterium LBB04]